jgi:hypothetical protein
MLHGTLTRQRSGLVNPDRPDVTDSRMSSDLMFLGLRVRPYKQLTVNLDFQDLATNNSSGLSALPPGSGTSLLNPGVFAGDIRTLTGRVSYPIGGGRTAFAEVQDAAYGGSRMSARKNAVAAGVEFTINRILGVTLGAEFHDYRDALRSENSYRARLLSASLAARF